MGRARLPWIVGLWVATGLAGCVGPGVDPPLDSAGGGGVHAGYGGTGGGGGAGGHGGAGGASGVGGTGGSMDAGVQDASTDGGTGTRDASDDDAGIVNE